MDWTQLIAVVIAAVLAAVGWSIKNAFDGLVQSVADLSKAVVDLRNEVQTTNQRLAKIEEWQRIFEKMEDKGG